MSKANAFGLVVPVGLFAVVSAILVIYRENHPWIVPVIVVCAVGAGTFIGARRKSKSRGIPGLRIAEVSTSELSELQEVAISQGLRSISKKSIKLHLRPDGTHYIVLRKSIRRKVDQKAIARCVVIFDLVDVGFRVGDLEMEKSSFDDLVHVQDQARVKVIVKSHFKEPAYADSDLTA